MFIFSVVHFPIFFLMRTHARDHSQSVFTLFPTRFIGLKSRKCQKHLMRTTIVCKSETVDGFFFVLLFWPVFNFDFSFHCFFFCLFTDWPADWFQFIKFSVFISVLIDFKWVLLTRQYSFLLAVSYCFTK